MQKKILVIDDDPSLVALLYHSLTEQGYEVYKAHDGQEGLRQIYSHQPDLIILDIIMPKLDGWQVCRRTREMSDVPIIMLSTRGKEEDIVRGLDHGADDYLSKPFSVTELLARVRAVLRRAALPPPTEEPVAYSDEYLTVNVAERRVIVRGEPVKLTPTAHLQPTAGEGVGLGVQGRYRLCAHIHLAPAPEDREGPQSAAVHPHRVRGWLSLRFERRVQ
jgi:DNA-binding response OmpR family regulator